MYLRALKGQLRRGVASVSWGANRSVPKCVLSIVMQIPLSFWIMDDAIMMRCCNQGHFSYAHMK
jgi:hypothetical protein